MYIGKCIFFFEKIYFNNMLSLMSHFKVKKSNTVLFNNSCDY